MLKSDDRLRFGVCWYPDHWPRERWQRDLGLMRDAGLECVRWGEGSWTLMQPERGRFEWSFVDEVIELCARSGLGVILGTPTYAAPAWLEEQQPEIIARRQDGTPWYRHSRRYYDYTQPAYREACDAIVQAMAERYAGDERVWAWQLDNEMWCHLGELWGDSTRGAFQRWLARRYGAVSALNDAWGLAFWSNQLDHFGQADLPGPTTAYLNHHQCADYRHFLSELAIEFLGRQRELIVAHDPAALVLHNCPFGPIDRARLLEGLDIYGHDHYPRFAGAAEERPAMGHNYGRFRAYAQRLWVVEQQASQVGQTSYRFPAAPPGELSVTALQSIAHGCDLLAWFRWRSYPAAQETNWGGLLPHWGEPGRHYHEARELIAALAPHAELIASTRPLVHVARLVSYRQQVAAEVEPWIGAHLGDVETGRRALRRLGLNEDTLRPRDLKAPLALDASARLRSAAAACGSEGEPPGVQELGGSGRGAPHLRSSGVGEPGVASAREQGVASALDEERAGSEPREPGVAFVRGGRHARARYRDLDHRYPLALLPLAVALDAEDIAALTAYMQGGGVLVIGPLAGHRCTKLQGPRDEPPGSLRALTGTANGEGTTLDEPALLRCRRSGASVEASRYAELLELRSDDVEVLAEHGRGWFAGSAAVVQRAVGGGFIVHSGVALNDAVLGWLWREHLAARLPSLPPALSVSSTAAEVLTRRSRECAIHFVLNHGAEPTACEVHCSTRDLFDGAEVPAHFELPGFAYRVLRQTL